eukprot:TRINITY_DN1715_c0_g1_i4.p1 TRINITY_DN1715_c0_g1~~TRINITY_DN1715_c0_g1_i4.p1  ORF type:complete len:1370 (-),score=583.04 TRINITY_DN1715_c0_g1_i4:139-4248(-)
MGNVSAKEILGFDIEKRKVEFAKTRATHLVNDKRDLIFANINDTVKQTLDLLNKENVIAVPIFNDKNEPLAMISMFDIVCHIFLNGEDKEVMEEKMNDTLGSIIGEVEEHEHLTRFGPDEPLEKLAEPMSGAIHRVLVTHRVDQNDKPIYRMCTQTDIIRHFIHYSSSFPDVQKNIQELELAKTSLIDLVTMKDTQTAYEGFKIMKDQEKIALPIVDENGRLVATLSCSDLKGTNVDNLEDLHKPVIEFLREKNGGKLEQPVTCSEGDSLFLVMLFALSLKVHRVWIIDNEMDRNVQGVVSLTDIINKIRGVDEDLQSRVIGAFGKEAMQSLSKANVLISGMTGLGAEVAKNVILSAVNSVTLHDTKKAEIGDLGSNFYLTEEHVGHNRATSILKRMRELNPNVKVTATMNELSNELVGLHSVVVLIGSPTEESIRINNFCREKGIKFIKADTYGLAGGVFCDFGDKFVIKDPTGEAPGVNIISKIEEDGKIIVVSEEQISFGDDAMVRFTEIKGEGLECLNDGVPRQVTDVHPFSFKIKLSEAEKDLDFSKYVTGGIVEEVKLEKEMAFDSYESVYKAPFINDSDLSKFGRSIQLHAIFQGLDAFRRKHNRLVKPRSKEDIEEVIAATKAFIDQEGGYADMGLQLDEEICKLLVSGSVAVLNPIATTFGGIVGQEVIKAATRKFTPINQFLYLDSIHSLPKNIEELPDEEFERQNSRYDHQIAVFGKTYQQKLHDQKYFLVGSGALGCEFMKNFAMCGIGCGENGYVKVTDDDVIEKSNLSRQFLFRNWHIHKLKSEVSCAVAKHMNPDFHPIPMMERVMTSTENVFNDDFWNDLTGVCNALDNIKARLYIDQRCIRFEKSLLESGTLGPKCHSQVVIPHKTQHYGATPDPPDKHTPACTLHNFPHNVEHCLQWGRSQFVGNFEDAPDEVKKFYSSEDYIKEMKDNGMSEKDILEKLESIQECLSFQTTSFEDCIRWARLKFDEYFTNKILQLTHNFPKDATTKKGSPFWAPPKRYPDACFFDHNDVMHMQFIISATNLRANICGIPVPVEGNANRNVETYVPTLTEFQPPKFQPSEDKKIKAEASAEEGEEVNIPLDVEQEIQNIIDSLPKKEEVQWKMTPEDFEKDDDYNHHMDFIGAVGNLRARNYQIGEVDKLKAKLIAGRIIPAIATATATATGLIMLELYKLVSGRDVGADFKTCGEYRNTSNNLALAEFNFYDTTLPDTHTSYEEKIYPDPENHPEYFEEEEHIAIPDNYTIWDKIYFDLTPSTTIQDIIDHFKKEYEIDLTTLAIETKEKGKDKMIALYATYLGHKDRLNKSFFDLYLTRFPEKSLPPSDCCKWIIPSLAFERDEAVIDTPVIIFNIKEE